VILIARCYDPTVVVYGGVKIVRLNQFAGLCTSRSISLQIHLPPLRFEYEVTLLFVVFILYRLLFIVFISYRHDQPFVGSHSSASMSKWGEAFCGRII
jgi:hypothetical protein